MRRLHVTILILLAASLGFAANLAHADDESETHLAALRSQVEDLTIDVVKRERIAMEMAATLDRAANRRRPPRRDVRDGPRQSACSTSSGGGTPRT